VSLLWNRLVAKIIPPRPGSIGLIIGRNSLLASQFECEGGSHRIINIAEELFQFPLFSAATPSTENRETLCLAMQRLSSQIPQLYWPLHISLPDPAVIVQIMEFDSVPKSVKDREAIALFRLGKELPGLPSMRCSTQLLGEEHSKELLMSNFVQEAWLDCIEEACQKAGYVPSVIDAGISFIFNHCYEVIQSAEGGGALISIEPDAWSLLFWDVHKRPRFIRSRWRETSSSCEEELELIAIDIERLTMSYALRVPECKIGKILICASESEFELLASGLNERMHISCEILDLNRDGALVQGGLVPDKRQSILALVDDRT